MNVNLSVSAASKIVTMSGCSRGTENSCGIAYRNG